LGREEKKLGDVVEKDRKIRYGIVQPGVYAPNEFYDSRAGLLCS
jgi:hypothetical protein